MGIMETYLKRVSIEESMVMRNSIYQGGNSLYKRAALAININSNSASKSNVLKFPIMIDPIDFPGLDLTEIGGLTKAEIQLVTEITDHHIFQPSTICLAVIFATVMAMKGFRRSS